MKILQGISILFFILVFQHCKTKKTTFIDSENNINNNIMYSNPLIIKSIGYKNIDTVVNDKKFSNHLAIAPSKKSVNSVEVFDKSLHNKAHLEKDDVVIEKEQEQAQTGPIKTIRKGFVIAALLLLVIAILFLFISLFKWQSIFLLWSSISAAIGYVLFKLGKKRLKTSYIEANKKQLKLLKKIALLIGFVSGLIYMLTLIF